MGLIQLFVATPFVSADASEGSNLPTQTFYPRPYWKGLVYACLVLLKLSFTQTLPPSETHKSETAIQQAVDLLTACSSEEGADELHRVARLIRLLRQDAMQEIVKPRHEVRSRMGASLMYEIILSVLVWKKQKVREGSGCGPKDEGTDMIEDPAEKATAGLTSDMSPHAMDELFASSGYLIEGLGPVGFDTNFWETSFFDQVSLVCRRYFFFLCIL